MLKSINRLFGNQGKRRPGRTVTVRAAEPLEYRLQLSASAAALDAIAAPAVAAADVSTAETDSYFEQIGEADGEHTYPADDGVDYELQTVETPAPVEQIAFNEFPEITTERGLFDEPEFSTNPAGVFRAAPLQTVESLTSQDTDDEPPILANDVFDVSLADQQVSEDSESASLTDAVNSEAEVEAKTADGAVEQDEAEEATMATAKSAADSDAEEAAAITVESPELETIQTRIDQEVTAGSEQDPAGNETIDQFFASEEAQVVAIDNRFATASLALITTGRVFGSRKRHKVA